LENNKNNLGLNDGLIKDWHIRRKENFNRTNDLI